MISRFLFHSRTIVLILCCLPFLYSCEREQSVLDEKTRTTAALTEPAGPVADLVVIGAGIAGLAAAVEAANLGRSVLVVDMASVFGGHAVMSGGGVSIINTPMQQAKGIRDSAELAFNDFVSWGEDVNTEWLRYYIEHSREDIYDWLVDLGVEFSFILGPHGNSVPRMHFPGDAGLGLVNPIYRAALQSARINFSWNSRADDLVIRDGRITGVSITNIRSNKKEELLAHRTLIATGGFQSNLEMVLQNWRDDYPVPDKILAGSGWYSLGSGLQIADTAGAQLENLDYMWNYISGVPDPRYPGEDRGVRVFMGMGGTSVWLNQDGERFVNECLSMKEALPAVLRQSEQNHWLVFDSIGRKGFNVAGSGWTPEKVEREVFANEELMKIGDTLEELAEKLSIPATNLQRSIARFNDHVEAGEDEDFNRFGRHAPAGIPCPAAGKLEKPPFYAIKRYPLARKSMGGIKIDLQGRVLSAESGDIIPGLFAAGEAAGFGGINGKAGLEGTFLGPAIVTGRVAARAIADELAGIPVVQAATARTEHTLPSAGGEIDLDCNTCHQIPALVKANRSGYRHFEFVHATVLERNMACETCHTGMSPYRPAAHSINPLHLSATCRHCHGTGD